MNIQGHHQGFNTSGRLWLRDFDFGLTGLTVRKTGARVPYNQAIFQQVYAWFQFFFAVRRTERIGPPFTIAFSPERARPWYLVWAVSRVAGGRLVTDASKADVVMHFEDATYSPNAPPPNRKPSAKLINFNCRDVSKSHVSAASEAAFGHRLTIDPANHVGPAVEKSEINAAHDGRIVQCPTTALPGRAYQKVIDNTGSDPDIVDDLRTTIVGGQPVCVFIKRRHVTKRFLNTNSEVLLADPAEIFSPAELAQIADFTGRIGLDWGGVDVLRDRADGRLYIVDANKTDMGPPIALPLPDKIKALHKLAAAFRDYVSRPQN